MLFTFLAFQVLCASANKVLTPFNDQYPSLPRVGQNYSFQLSKATFEDMSQQLSLQNAPSWISISQNGVLTGVPTASSNSSSFEIVCGTTSMNVQLPVSSAEPPSNMGTLVTQLEQFGTTNGKHGLILTPGKPFTISFLKSKTFSKGSSDIVAYYGLAENRTALPAWVKFSVEGQNLTFSGTAPSVTSDIAPSTVYSFDLVAADAVGFTGALQSFQLLIGAHDLVVQDLSPVSVSDAFSAEIPLNKITLDGQRLVNASYALTDAPSWVALQGSKVVGTVPHGCNTCDFYVDVVDVYGDTVSVQFAGSSSYTNTTSTSQNGTSAMGSSENGTSGSTGTNSSLFADSLPPLKLSSGYFTYALPDSLFDRNSTSVEVQYSRNVSWVHFNAGNYSFSGRAPSRFKKFNVTLLAVSNKNVQKRNLNQITLTVEGPSGLSKHQILAIVLGTVIPVIFIISAVLVWCINRKRKQFNETFSSADESPKFQSTSTIAKSNNSSPYPGQLQLRFVEKFLVPQSAHFQEQFSESTEYTENYSDMSVIPKDSNQSRLETSGETYHVSYGSLDPNSPADIDTSGDTYASADAYINPETAAAAAEAIAATHRTPQFKRSSPYLSPDIFPSPKNVHKKPSRGSSSIVPRKSWRRYSKLSPEPYSENSLGTVQQNELVSVRMVDAHKGTEYLERSSITSSYYEAFRFVASREDSGNVQRLDSLGHIVYPSNAYLGTVEEHKS